MSLETTPEAEVTRLKKAMMVFEDGLTQLLDLYLDTRQMLLYADIKDQRQYLEKCLDDLRKGMHFFKQGIYDNFQPHTAVSVQTSALAGAAMDCSPRVRRNGLAHLAPDGW